MKTLDWAATEAKAEKMSDGELHWALLDIQKTLPAADSLDLLYGTSDEGGYYRDEASVYHREIARRRGGA